LNCDINGKNQSTIDQINQNLFGSLPTKQVLIVESLMTNKFSSLKLWQLKKLCSSKLWQPKIENMVIKYIFGCKASKGGN
jgi:hypothetical protein